MLDSRLSSPLLDAWGIPHQFFSNAPAGVEAVRLPRQVHGTRVVRPESLGERPADGLWTTRAGQRIGVRTADCVPVLLAHEDGAVAAIHAGWRGAAERIVLRFLGRSEGLGRPMAGWRAALGPAAGGCCYEVGPEVAVRFGRPGRRLRLDLRELLVERLEAVGVRCERVGPCTICGGPPWASWRREGRAAGRNVAVIAAGAGGRP